MAAEDRTINQLTEDELTAIAVLIVGERNQTTWPDGTPAHGWDRYGVTQVLRSQGHELANTLQYAAVAAARDHRADTPVAITWNKYRPKPADTEHEPDRGPKCDICGRSQRMCLEVRAKEERHGVPDPHDFVPVDLDRYRRGPIRPAHT
jgi:hypothetical protein